MSLFSTQSRVKRISLKPRFLRALKRNDVNEVRTLINDGMDVDTTFYIGYNLKSALCICIEERKTEVARLLIENGCSVSLTTGIGLTPLHLAVIYKINELVTLLLHNCASVNARDHILQTPLHSACSVGSYDDYLVLADAGADLDVTDIDRRTPLLYACSSGNTRIAMSLVERGADVNVKDCLQNSALVYAVSIEPSYALVRALINRGAWVNTEDADAAVPVLCFVRSFQDNFPFDTLAGCRILKLLINSGCKLNVKTTSGLNCLHIAMSSGNADIVKVLLNAGCPNEPDALGKTPLYFACYYNYYELVQLLIAAGINWPQETWLQNEARKAMCNEDLVRHCVAESKKSPTLCHLCRVVLRRFMGPEIDHCVDQLPCPPLIKEYLKLDHY